MTTTDGRDAAQFIRDQHEEIKRLMAQVDGRTGDERQAAFEELVHLLAVHETAEEVVIYPVVRSEPGGDEVVDLRTQEEGEAKRMLADLEKVDTGSDEFAPRFNVLRDAVLRHATSEEKTVLPLLERTQDQDKLDRLGQAVRAAERLAPTHPHPNAPDSALGNLAVGPMAAVIDRTRDALRDFTP